MSENYRIGDVLCVDEGFYKHVGISDGKGMVYENSRNKGVRHVNEEEFSGNKNIINSGKLGSKKPEEIIQKAKEIMANPQKYNLISNNCEHFIREACGVDIKSPQVQNKVLLTGIISIAFLAIPQLRIARFVYLGVSAVLLVK